MDQRRKHSMSEAVRDESSPWVAAVQKLLVREYDYLRSTEGLRMDVQITYGQAGLGTPVFSLTFFETGKEATKRVVFTDTDAFRGFYPETKFVKELLLYWGNSIRNGKVRVSDPTLFCSFGFRSVPLSPKGGEGVPWNTHYQVEAANPSPYGEPTTGRLSLASQPLAPAFKDEPVVFTGLVDLIDSVVRSHRALFSACEPFAITDLAYSQRLERRVVKGGV